LQAQTSVGVPVTRNPKSFVWLKSRSAEREMSEVILRLLYSLNDHCLRCYIIKTIQVPGGGRPSAFAAPLGAVFFRGACFGPIRQSTRRHSDCHLRPSGPYPGANACIEHPTHRDTVAGEDRGGVDVGAPHHPPGGTRRRWCWAVARGNWPDDVTVTPRRNPVRRTIQRKALKTSRRLCSRCRAPSVMRLRQGAARATPHS